MPKNHLKTTSSKVAFLIAMQDYQHLEPLSTPNQDVTEIAKGLEKVYKYEVYTNLSQELSSLTLNRLFEETLDKIVKGLPEDSQLIIYFAGHGYAEETDRGMKGYLIPKEGMPGAKTTWYSMDKLVERISRYKIRHVALVLDCCFGGNFRFSTTLRAGGLPRNPSFFRQHFVHYTSHPSWQVLTSTAPNQEAIDFINRPGANGHSPFAKLFMDGLIRREADLNKNSVITLSELFSFIQAQLPIITARLEGAAQRPGLFPFPNEKHQNGEFLFFADGFDPNALTELDYLNPYKGLEPYKKEDKNLFFGRDEALKLLNEHINQHDFVVVTGASGSGKSSLVQAGILPELEKKKSTLLIKPGRNPLPKLKRLSEYDLLVVDQLEELITQSNRVQQPKFWKEIMCYLKEGKQVIVTVRVDFEAQFELPDELKEKWEVGRFPIPQFTAEELREIIITPALRVGRFFDPLSLVDEMVNEVLINPRALPLLSYTLQELFKQCEKDPYLNISKEVYDKIGGVQGALTTNAGRVYDRLDDLHQKAMRNLMLRMVSISGGEKSGKRVYEHELQFKDPEETQRFKKVIAILQDEERLIRSDVTSDGETFYQPSHDALVNVWKKMTTWIKQFSEEKIILHSRLESAVLDYTRRRKRWRNLWITSPYRQQIMESTKGSEAIPLNLNGMEEQFLLRSTRLLRGIWIVIILFVVGAFSGILAFALQSNQNALQAKENLSDYHKKERERLNQELGTLKNNVEIYEKAEEFQMAINTCDTLKARVDSIHRLTAILKDVIIFNPQIDTLEIQNWKGRLEAKKQTAQIP